MRPLVVCHNTVFLIVDTLCAFHTLVVWRTPWHSHLGAKPIHENVQCGLINWNEGFSAGSRLRYPSSPNNGFKDRVGTFQPRFQPCYLMWVLGALQRLYTILSDHGWSLPRLGTNTVYYTQLLWHTVCILGNHCPRLWEVIARLHN